MMARAAWLGAGLLLLSLAGCARPATLSAAQATPEPASTEEAEAVLARLRASEPESFKMVHQVVAQYQGQSHVMTGYLLGRKDGAFRVSAAAGIGPRLFDVARVDGRWEARVHLRQLAERMDPTHLGRAVERIYFLTATGPLEREQEGWVSRSAVTGEEDFDTVEVLRDSRTLAMVRKRFSKQGRRILEIDYEKLEPVGGHWLARFVRLVDVRGFELKVSVTGYEPGFPVPEERLRVAPPAPASP
jgi:hypothetical protein